MSNLDKRAGEALQREVQRFYWGVWSELGVSGWGRTHEDWAIDPEPLIVFSPSVMATEPRLRDEVIDWCSDNWRHVSAARLRNLLNDNEIEQTNAWGQFAATVNRYSGAAKWPQPSSERKFARTGRSSLRPLSDPSMIYLRMRSIFGLSARTEVLRYLLFTRERSTAAMLAVQANYTKRNVAEACDSLTRAGVLQSKQIGNRLYFSLVDEPALSAFLKPSAYLHPDWPALLRIVNALFRWSHTAICSEERALVVETHLLFNTIQEDLETLKLEAPDRVTGAEFLPIWRRWSVRLMKALAGGEWPANISEATVQTTKPNESNASARSEAR
ncbi:MAG TPA: hypothetical protein VHV57_12205 [Acidimicrobiales bacterium]|jgi:hypothetical protein|nr:hypothetical protein [Acidimicrobiales bacterium]